MKWLWKMLLPLAVLVAGCQGKEELPAGDHLKPLSWLVGSWQFNSEARQVHLSNEWTLNNSYLKQTFQLTIPGKEELQGFQLIGWDPVAKSVHSWVFDSDGGFGEAHWSQQEESWIAMMVFIFADGRKGSSTNIYQKLDDKSYSFTSKEREIEGEWLPDVGPITVIRKGGVQ